MESLPKLINTAQELEEVLSRPSAGAIEAVKRLKGDIMILGAGGKVGPTLALLAKRAVEAASAKSKVIAVDVASLAGLKAKGIETIKCDLMDLAAIEKLPAAENIVYMVGRQFGSGGDESLAWAVNVIIPYHVARTFAKSRIAALSAGCVYSVMDIRTGGATEETLPAPVGEYAMSCLGRERMFDYFSENKGERVVHIRLNNAVELRHGLFCDIAGKIWSGVPVDVTTGFANAIWQGDASNQVLQSLEFAAVPSKILNVTGPETFAIRDVAHRLGRLMGKPVIISGEENGMGYINNARNANALFGNPTVPLGLILEWTANWVKNGGETRAGK